MQYRSTHITNPCVHALHKHELDGWWLMQHTTTGMVRVIAVQARSALTEQLFEVEAGEDDTSPSDWHWEVEENICMQRTLGAWPGWVSDPMTRFVSTRPCRVRTGPSAAPGVAALSPCHPQQVRVPSLQTAPRRERFCCLRVSGKFRGFVEDSAFQAASPQPALRCQRLHGLAQLFRPLATDVEGALRMGPGPGSATRSFSFSQGLSHLPESPNAALQLPQHGFGR